MIFLANKARREGILSLEDGLDELAAAIPDKTGVLAIQSGNNPDFIRELFASYVGIEYAEAFKTKIQELSETLWNQYRENNNGADL
ncbi:MAG: hypothetical protein K6G80_01160 [Treponema sp.]|nr:hypothetical protein [Treponema sp.]